jgi:hypothetical protein
VDYISWLLAQGRLEFELEAELLWPIARSWARPSTEVSSYNSNEYSRSVLCSPGSSRQVSADQRGCALRNKTD